MIPKPTAQQLRWQEKELGLFCHFGINTFNGKEWSNGSLVPASFAPSDLNADQWVQTARDAGMGYVVLTAKHHDGFCLWPSDTTDYSVKSSPFRGGKGDVVGELAEACRQAAMPMGLYLSPWDRHEPCYGDAKAYDAFYVRQLTELCTRYGPMFELWFDGAGSEGRRYDWPAIMDVVRTHQPDAMIFNMGEPTIRWVGNEDGLTEDPNYYAVSATDVSAFTDLKDALPAGQKAYLPPECDVAIRQNWFWQDDDLATLKSVEHLLGIYYRSVGLGGNLLLNVPPDRRGLICDEDRARLIEMIEEIRRRFARPVAGKLHQQNGVVTVDFDRAVEFDLLILQEELRDGQHIDGHRIYSEPDGAMIAVGKTVGHKRFHLFKTVKTARLRIELNSPQARLTSAEAHKTGHVELPTLGAKVDYNRWEKKADRP